MQKDQQAATGLILVTAFFFLLLFSIPAAAFGDIPVNTTIVNNTSVHNDTVKIITAAPATVTIPASTITPATENGTGFQNPPPVLTIGTPVIENLTATIYGSVAPGSGNVTLMITRWDWGDDREPEYHGFPYSHVFSSPGTYTVSVTAVQSDGQALTRRVNITVVQPVIPTLVATPVNASVPVIPMGPGIGAGAPVLTLLEPVVDRQNVTLNGNLNPGSPGVTIDFVSIDWNDGTKTESDDLPVSHQYAEQGIYTIAITGNQSDNQSTTKRLTVDLKGDIPGMPGNPGNPGGPGPAASPPPAAEPPVLLFIVATVITVVAILGLVQLIVHRRKATRHAAGKSNGYSPKTGRTSQNLPSIKDLENICTGTDVTPDILEAVIQVASEIAREGREGQAIGTSFVVGDTENVMQHSKQFVLNPFHGHHEAKRQITDIGIRGHIKEFAQLDGAFLVTGSGVVEAAGRCITVDMSKVSLPGGLGSRHSSVAGITQVTRSIGVVVSQSGGLITVFREGKIVFTICS